MANTNQNIRKSKILDIPCYGQKEEFMSAAACVVMVMKYLNKNYKVKDDYYKIWQDTLGGSMWHGSRYGIAYALAKRGAKPEIITNAKDEGYEKKLAVYEGENLDILHASFQDIQNRCNKMNIKENYGVITINKIKKLLNEGRIPIIVVDANVLDPTRESSPHWVVVKGYDKDMFYINDPYQNVTVSMEPEQFKKIIGYDNEHHMVAVQIRKNPNVGKIISLPKSW
ncbi:MAG: peptidase C39 family protein [Candidatus Micrarchaeaceae archaeon]